MEQNTCIVQKVIIATNAPDPLGCSNENKILQVYTLEGRLIAVEPAFYQNQLREKEDSWTYVFNESEKVKKELEHTRRQLGDLKRLKDELIGRLVIEMLPMIHLGRRGLSIGRTTNKQRAQFKKAEELFKEINSLKSKYNQ